MLWACGYVENLHEGVAPPCCCLSPKGGRAHAQPVHVYLYDMQPYTSHWQVSNTKGAMGYTSARFIPIVRRLLVFIAVVVTGTWFGLLIG